MNRSRVLALLSDHHDEIVRRFDVKDLFIFGSAARDEMHEGSDVDILVEFQGPATFDGYIGLRSYLETILGASVDLVTRKGLKPRARRQVEREQLHVA
jgi:hypothetical protein